MHYSASYPKTRIRVSRDNPNHHLWNNNGTWFMHYVLHSAPRKKVRVRCSLQTKSIAEARRRRDIALKQFGFVPEAAMNE